MSLCQFAKGMSVYLARQVGLPQNQVDRLRFGLEIIIGSLIKVMSVLYLFPWLGAMIFLTSQGQTSWAKGILVYLLIALLILSQASQAFGGSLISSSKTFSGAVLWGDTLFPVSWTSIIRLDYSGSGNIRTLCTHSDMGCISRYSYGTPPFSQGMGQSAIPIALTLFGAFVGGGLQLFRSLSL